MSLGHSGPSSLYLCRLEIQPAPFKLPGQVWAVGGTLCLLPVPSPGMVMGHGPGRAGSREVPEATREHFCPIFQSRQW